jgi:hypothetical protein
MKIPETPASVSDLDLMRTLEDYAEGRSTWYHDKSPLGQNAKKASRVLHTHVVQIVEKVLAPIMDRATARELDTFTMHDRLHGRKVAHLMWHILSPERQCTLTPPEIGLLVLAAHLHDAGMALSREDRECRLAPESDLWDRAEASPTIKRNLKRLRDLLGDPKLADSKRVRIESELFQAEEALLALDTRERHAVRERYEEIIAQLYSFHLTDPTRIPDIEECFSFDGDSFRKKLIDICVSHNEDADVLVERDHEHFDRARFPRSLPVGLANADIHMAAASLRLADILDFDRERTPPTLFHYLVPSSLSHSVTISELEWGKHLSISNWEIDQSAVVFRGRCKNHIVHHAVVQFCKAIEEEIASTKATFAVGDSQTWPFVLPETVKTDIHEGGYRYVPYKFELDDTRVYELLMGRAIYDNPLVAVRELIQNAVDACSYRDALSKLAEPNSEHDRKNRITIRYEEPNAEGEYPVLRVIDTGTGMDAWLIERWFLKVGRSYYNSTEFVRDRLQFRQHNIDFAPVSEFGIGFLSCFLLADRVDVETAMGESLRGDTRKRHLEIDGPTRLIRIREDVNTGLKRLRGTRVSLTLVRGGRTNKNDAVAPPSWKEIRLYIELVCQDIPYRLNLEHVSAAGIVSDAVDRRPMTATLSSLYVNDAVRIPVLDPEAGLEGEIAIVSYVTARRLAREGREISPVRVIEDNQDIRWGRTRESKRNVLLRGGFNVGGVPGLPSLWEPGGIGARVRTTWNSTERQRYASTNLARTAVADEATIATRISEIWLRYLIENRHALPKAFMYGIGFESGNSRLDKQEWLEHYSALTLYELAKNGWHFSALNEKKDLDPVSGWERGESAAPISSVGVYSDLLELILPLIAPERFADENGDTFVMPPVKGWKEVLSSCYDFISRPVRWSRFVSYRGKISRHLLHATYLALPFNKRYSAMLEGAKDEQLRRVSHLLDQLTKDYERGNLTTLSRTDVELLEWLFELVGDAEVSHYETVVRLSTFRPKA